jgi:hypothetical protein
MCSKIDWLPDLVLFDDYNGNWEKYLDALYAFFKADFIDSTPVYMGKRLNHKRYPLTDGKEATFWHLISTGKVEDDRLPDFRRCERIRWSRPIIDNSNDSRVKVWMEILNREQRIHLLCPDDRYLVVLAVRKGYIIPWTAFYIEYNHQLRKKLQKYEDYKKLKPPQ